VNPPDGTTVVQRSSASFAVEAYYKKVQNDLLVRGLMRTDSGAHDAPFTQAQLIEDFIQIGLFDEYSNVAGNIVARRSATPLRRWERPVRMDVRFGDTVPQEQREKDRKDIHAYARRLGQITGHSIAPTQAPNGNFTVLVLNEDDRRAYGPELRAMLPGIDDTLINTVVGMPRSTFCLVFALSRPGDVGYSRAVAVIRGEHPDLLRLSCIHEELAQGLGLANDSPAARPSVFNDDEEFALLTRHDALLLEMLFDRRLRVGMTAEEVRPILRQIAAELMGGSS